MRRVGESEGRRKTRNKGADEREGKEKRVRKIIENKPEHIKYHMSLTIGKIDISHKTQVHSNRHKYFLQRYTPS